MTWHRHTAPQIRLLRALVQADLPVTAMTPALSATALALTSGRPAQHAGSPLVAYTGTALTITAHGRKVEVSYRDTGKESPMQLIKFRLTSVEEDTLRFHAAAGIPTFLGSALLGYRKAPGFAPPPETATLRTFLVEDDALAAFTKLVPANIEEHARAAVMQHLARVTT